MKTSAIEIVTFENAHFYGFGNMHDTTHGLFYFTILLLNGRLEKMVEEPVPVVRQNLDFHSNGGDLEMEPRLHHTHVIPKGDNKFYHVVYHHFGFNVMLTERKQDLLRFVKILVY
jgi:hypothetical protein